MCTETKNANREVLVSLQRTINSLEIHVQFLPNILPSLRKIDQNSSGSTSGGAVAEDLDESADPTGSCAGGAQEVLPGL